ncbi:MAG: hypothetical protein IAF94_01135 [Pirellulaceae bacterium]|nr:hypothetical protein [Pirellulaceae bacterium]
MSDAHTTERHPLRLVLCGVVLPAVVALATYLAMQPLSAGLGSVLQSTLVFAFFIFEVGLVGGIVGHSLPQPLFRWMIYGWVMLLVDLLVCSHAMISSDGYIQQILPAAALVSAQVGLAIVWGILGTGRWYWRAPLAVGLGAGMLWFWISCVNGWSGRLMTQVLVVQAIVLFLITAGLWVRGYRLEITLPEVGNGKGRGRLQFGIRDVLIWTTVMAILLGLMRGAGMLVWVTFSDHPSVFLMSTVGFLSAVVILFAVWASLGKGHPLLRYGLLVVMLLVLGAGMGAACVYGDDWLQQRAKGLLSYRGYDYDLHSWLEVGWWWIAWMFLSGGLLAASLLVFRAVGYRLVRRK